MQVGILIIDYSLSENYMNSEKFEDSMEVETMVLGILLAIVGLIVGLGLGVAVVKSRHEKAIDGAKILLKALLKVQTKKQKL